MPTTKACLSCDAYVEARTRYCDKCQSILVGVDEFVMPDMAPPKAGRRLLDARIGTVLGGSLVIESFLGHGGDGPVYRGRDRQTGAIVGVKRERSGASAPVDGPHVVATLPSVRSADDKPFVVMEICTGGTLRDALDASAAAGHGLGHARIVEILRQIVRGLASYHTRGLVHGDLKPENVLLSQAEGGKVVLKLADALGGEGGPGGANRGTPPYAAPEVCAGAAPSVQADFWALGVIAFELVTGRLPFEATGAEGLARQVASESVRVPALGRDVRRGLAALVRALLDRTPSGRPEGVVPILEALDRIEAEALPWERPAALAIAGFGLAMLLVGLVLGGDSPKPVPVEPPPPVVVVPAPASGSASGAVVPAVAPKPPVETKLPSLDVVRQRLRAVGTSDLPDGVAPADTAAVLTLDLKTAPASDLTVDLEIDELGGTGRFVPVSSKFETKGQTLLVDVPAQAVGRRTLKVALRSKQHEPRELKFTQTFTWFEAKPSVAVTADGGIRCRADGFARVAIIAGNETVLEFEAGTPPTEPALLRRLPKEWEAPARASFYLAGESTPVAFDPPVAVSVEGRPFKPELEMRIEKSFQAGEQLPEFRVRCIAGCSFSLRKLGVGEAVQNKLSADYEAPSYIVKAVPLSEAGRFGVFCSPPPNDQRPEVKLHEIEVKPKPKPVFDGVEARVAVKARCEPDQAGKAVVVRCDVDGTTWPAGVVVEPSEARWSCVEDASKPGRWIFTRPAVADDESVVRASDISFDLNLGGKPKTIVASHKDALGAAPLSAHLKWMKGGEKIVAGQISCKLAATYELLYELQEEQENEQLKWGPFWVYPKPIGAKELSAMSDWLTEARNLVPDPDDLELVAKIDVVKIDPKREAVNTIPHKVAIAYVTWLNRFALGVLVRKDPTYVKSGYNLISPLQMHAAADRLSFEGKSGFEPLCGTQERALTTEDLLYSLGGSRKTFDIAKEGYGVGLLIRDVGTSDKKQMFVRLNIRGQVPLDWVPAFHVCLPPSPK